MRGLGLMTLLVTLAAAEGCIFPLPHIKQTCGTIEGTVIDAETGAPVENASVTVYYPDGGEQETKTDKRGGFRLGQKLRFHYAYVFGVALNYSLPYDMGWHGFLNITLDAKGYAPVLLPGPTLRWKPEEEWTRQDKYRPLSIKAEEKTASPDMSQVNWEYSRIPLDRTGPPQRAGSESLPSNLR